MIHRRGHYLEANKKTVTPHHALFLDVEAKEKPHSDGRIELVFWFGWAAYWRRSEPDHKRNVQWWRIENLDDFWDTVERVARPKNTLYVFSHNIYVDFSWLDSYCQLIGRGWIPSKPHVEGYVAILTWRKQGKKILFLDTGNYFHMTLEELGDGLGLEKQGTGGKPHPGTSWDDYCKRDVEIIMYAILSLFDFVESHDLGGFARTAPSQAFRCYRHRFMPTPIWIHGRGEMTALERNSYHGGRVEIRYQGVLDDGPYYKLDINSAYPWAMWAYPFPSGDHHYMKSPTLSSLHKYLETHCVIARVQIETDEPVYPFRMGGRLTFPTGRFETVLTTRELDYALSHDHITDVLSLATYYKSALFPDYVDYFYQLRLKYKTEGNLAYASMCKLFLNGLSGKWGQRGIEREVVGECPINDAYTMMVTDLVTGKTHQEVHYGGQIYRNRKEGEAYHSFSAIIAHITGDVRIALWRYVKLAGYDHVLYLDTDSLWTDSVGFERLKGALNEIELGTLKVEGVADHIEIYAPKDYVFGTTTRHKGVARDAREISPGLFETTQWQGWKGSLRKAEFGQVFITPMIKRLHREIKKGVLQDDGSINPFNLCEIYERGGENKPIPALV